MHRRVSNHLRHNIVAWVALFFALTGTGIAASRYLITSTSQIKPSVLRQIAGQEPAAATAAAPKGAKAVIDRIRLVAPVMTVSEPAEGPFERPLVPLTGGTWTQATDQVNAIVGQITVTSPPSGQCTTEGGSFATIEVRLDGIDSAQAGPSSLPAGTTVTETFEWSPITVGRSEGGAAWLVHSRKDIVDRLG
ncbi:MAG TPA: hypothetical protein VII01_09440 [Solirubrobacteraceae bacterium]